MASLIFKWLKSENTSSAESRELATKTRKAFGMTSRDYRRALTDGRKYIDIVERKMSSNNWQAIDYEKVPSKANLIYKNAFLKHDSERRQAYLDALTSGEAKINSSASFPHDIAHKYFSEGYYKSAIRNEDTTLEEMWKALPDFVNGNGNTIVVADGSGSMTCNIDPKTSTTALEVANALAIYFAQHQDGPFKNKYITFSSRPQYVNLSYPTLRENLIEAYKHAECSTTNIEAVFDMVLKTAVDNKLRQEEIPNILIVSDMQFDGAVCCNDSKWSIPKTLFETIADKYASYNYTLPKLIFWNLNTYGRSKNVPVTQNENGVILVSGYSAAICKMVLSNKTDPYEAMVETLNSERYQAVEDAWNKAVS